MYVFVYFHIYREDDPPYAYFSYYIYANLLVLNRLRHDRGMNVFKYRPHGGEAGRYLYIN